MKVFRLIKEHRKSEPNYDFGDLHPFIFAPNTDPDYKPVELEDPEEDIIPACPFAEWSIEYDGEHYITAPQDHDALHIYFECIYVKELAPNSFEFIVGMEVELGMQRIYRTQKFTEEYPDEASYKSILNLVDNSIQRMRGHKKGTVRKSGKIRFKSKGRNIEYKPRNVIYVGSKKNDDRKKTKFGQPIHWIRGGDVMGHYRELKNPNSIGKDRLGNRTVKGFTWVIDHVRGAGDKKTKIRKVR